ncbi:hypothetical protein ZWY2020_054645 [Hordeum vulgare]|nr:hypothetical protein ZWY2020_054645 [Hordeum vulgare]
MPQTPRPPDAASTAGSGCSPAQPAEAADGMFYSHQLLARKASLGQIYCVPFPPFPSAPSSPASATRSRPPATDCAPRVFSVRCLQLDIAIVKATNHVERPAKEKYIRDIFMHLNSGRARADVAYCIRSLARRLSKTRNWVISLKMLIVIHRALREVDPSFRDELISYGRSSGQMLHMSYFKDDSSHDGTS